MKNETTNKAPEKVTCIKCNGTGRLSYHLNIENGRCFACGGSGKVTVGRPYIVRPSREDIAHELRNLYRAARSQLAHGWGEPDDGYDVLDTVAHHLVLCPDLAEKALAAFVALLAPEIGFRLTELYTWRLRQEAMHRAAHPEAAA